MKIRSTKVRRAVLRGIPGGDLVVYAQYRRKKIIEAVGKVLVSDSIPSIGDIQEVPDYHGAQFMCERDGDVKRLLSHSVTRNPLLADVYYYKDRGIPPNSASRRFQTVIIKSQPPNVWIGREYQVTTVKEFLDAEYSTEESTHDLYKLRSHLPYTLPWLFPEEIFGID